MNPNPSIPLHSEDTKISNRLSKWISVDVLLDIEEMSDLIQQLDPFFLISPQNANPQTPYLLSSSEFLLAYQGYIGSLQRGKITEIQEQKKFFYLMMMPHLSGVYLKPITQEKKALIFKSPYIEIKPITLIVSPIDHSIRPMPGLSQGVLWGMRFSCPQIVQQIESHEVETISFQEHPLGKMFKSLREWIRHHTRPTPFIIHSKKINLPIRLGKNCSKWIHQHPQFDQYQLKVGL